MLVYVGFAESYRNDQQIEIQSAYFGNQSFSLFTSYCFFKGATSEIRNKSEAVVIENSDHNRITSVSCLKKVIDNMETECGKSFTNGVLWRDGMGAQFRSKFIFQLLAGTMFLNKSLCWFCNERHHGKGPTDGVGGTIKNVIFRKVKLGQIVVHTPKEFSHAVMKFAPSIIACLDQMKQLSLEAFIRHHPSPKHFQSTNLFDRSMTKEIVVQSFSRRR